MSLTNPLDKTDHVLSRGPAVSSIPNRPPSFEHSRSKGVIKNYFSDPWLTLRSLNVILHSFSCALPFSSSTTYNWVVKTECARKSDVKLNSKFWCFFFPVSALHRFTMTWPTLLATRTIPRTSSGGQITTEWTWPWTGLTLRYVASGSAHWFFHALQGHILMIAWFHKIFGGELLLVMFWLTILL